MSALNTAGVDVYFKQHRNMNSSWYLIPHRRKEACDCDFDLQRTGHSALVGLFKKSVSAILL